MSWSELERLVEQAESDAGLRRALMHCRSRNELVLACRRLGFAIDGHDLRIAWLLEQPPAPQAGDRRRKDSSPRRSVHRCG